MQLYQLLLYYTLTYQLSCMKTIHALLKFLSLYKSQQLQKECPLQYCFHQSTASAQYPL